MAKQTAEEALVVRLEATLAKFEGQMKRAQAVAGQTATGMEKRFDVASKKIAANADRAAVAVNRVAKSSGNNAALSNMSFQLQDIAVQMAGGTSAARALGQQLPQLLSGFGLLGAAMGTAAAVGLGLFDAFLSGGEKAETAAKQIDRLAAATANLREVTNLSTAEITEKYGELTEGLQKAIEKQKEFAMMETMEAAKATVEGLSTGVVDAADQIRTLQQRIAEYQSMSQEDAFSLGVDTASQIQMAIEAIGVFEDEIGLTADEALRLDDALKSWAAADTIYGQAEAISDIQTAIAGTSLETSTWARELNKAAIELHAAKDAAADATFSLEGARDAAMALASAVPGAGWLDGAIAGAASLAATLWNAAKARAAATSTSFPSGNDPSGKTYGGRGGDPRQYGANAGGTNTFNVENFEVPKFGGGGGRKGGGGGGGGRADEPFFEDAEADLQKLERQIELLGKSSQEVATLKAKWELLDEAKRRGLDLDVQLSGSSQTLAQQIDAQAASVGQLTAQLEAQEVTAEAFQEGIEGIADAMAQALTGGQSLREGLADVFAGIASDLAKSGIQSLLSNLFSGSGSGGGGGILGTIFNGIMSRDGGGYTWDGPRAGGLDGKGGRLAMLHPRETVIDHTKGQRVSSAPQVVQVVVTANDYFDARVDQRASAVSQAHVSQANRQMPDRSRAIAKDPRRR